MGEPWVSHETSWINFSLCWSLWGHELAGIQNEMRFHLIWIKEHSCLKESMIGNLQMLFPAMLRHNMGQDLNI